MKKQIILSIAMTSLLGLGADSALAAEASQPAQEVKSQSGHGGKCASGKCGTVKMYEKADIKHNPQDQLVRARDGKCGKTGQGIHPGKAGPGKMVEGVCGQ
ncbi:MULTISPECIES: hypothetical protein [Chromobacterium]|uniref:Uncharacterized protein n=1 Tax=Chromobacterium rhizoryzae TaxID=1778675 RepID=A0AAD0RQF0_9NEIS|nr:MULTISPECIES: hypothetical protein [Chromobacterium]AXT46642.1 hypothetical protein D1345_10760 [Chromobacterium rhizoryzae]MDH0340232.1 hypothetical protein [Chromobacterium haemolyticum]OQS30924.1 hypothetical protein B0T40_24135 [Chromobacterium haemolyticum]PTU69244.1 hypothetical protein DBB33_07215 [Chromobacterium haemolyticum]QOD84895.1 hypothetical protein IEZ30_10610 [Chromobacterium haemolyticum]